MFFVERIIASVAPHTCVACNAEGSLLCNWCLPDAFPALSDRCYHCFSLSADSATCKKCRNTSRPKHVWVVTEYEKTAKDLIAICKFGRSKAAAQIMARALHERLPILDANIAVVHIPTATSRRRQRGYDQSELIAKQLTTLHGLKHQPLLGRKGQTRQVGANKKQRLEQLKQAFWVRSGAVPDKVLLIDDLTTTGATLESATKVLKKAGVKRVYAATFAQRSV